MTGYISKKMLGAARLPDTPSARAYLDRVLDEDDDIQVYKRPWVDLTDGVMCDIAIDHGLMSIDWIDFARAIEAKLKELNA